MNCFKDYKWYKCIHISNRILDLAWPEVDAIKSETTIHVVCPRQSQYHACSCASDLRSQSISRHGIDPQSQNIWSAASEELVHWHHMALWKLVNVQLNVHLICQLDPLELIQWNFTWVKKSFYRNAYQNFRFAKYQQYCSDLDELKRKSHLLRARS